MHQNSILMTTNSLSKPKKLAKLKTLLENSMTLSKSRKKIILNLNESKKSEVNKLENLPLSQNLGVYLSLIEKPLNLLFSIDQFLFEFSKKSYQQRKTGDFFQQLKEKKKLSLFYGHLTKKQLDSFFAKAEKNKGYFSKNLFSLLERRLDMIIYRVGLTKTVAEARQLIKHKKVLVNSFPVTLPSYQVNPGDSISLTSETAIQLKNQLINEEVTKQIKTYPKIFGDFYSKLHKMLETDNSIYCEKFQSQLVCDLFINFICSRIKLRSFWVLKKTTDNELNFSLKNKEQNSSFRKVLTLLKWKLSSEANSTELLKTNLAANLKEIGKSKKENFQETLYANRGSLQKKPIFSNRQLTQFKQKTVFEKTLHTGKRRNLALYRSSFLLFFKYLESYKRFTSLTLLNIKKNLFKRSFHKKNTLIEKRLNFRVMKPLHLEVSYNLLNIIYLYSPQRLNFPFSIDLDLIKRSLNK